ncbi:MAG TPA: signal peptidase I [Candidatus Sulfotelmatobacter sp.]|nr:signal peptidase I [Candidatus Sulfotelmatobacter sp.]
MTSPVDGASSSRKSSTSLFRELLETAILTIAIFLVVRVALQNFKVEGESMEPNLHNGEYILVNKVDYLLHSPQRGDIVVFHAVPAGEPDRDFIKRVVGLPGDSVAVKNQTVYINGKPLHERYIEATPDYTFPLRKVPPGDYFVLGDNRRNSFDSSKWPNPFLQRSDIIGKAWVAYWPPADLSLFQDPSFASK